MNESKGGEGLGRRRVLGMMTAGGVISAFAPALLGRERAFAHGTTPNGSMIIGFSEEPTVFNPHLLHIEVDEGVYFAIFDTLFTVDPAGQFHSSLCSEVPTVANGGISEDGLHWRIKLRDDVKWHDGIPFTAEDVKFNLDLLVDPTFNSWRRTGHDLVRDLTVVSPTELTWRMAKPFAPYPSILAATFLIPKHAFDGVTDRNHAPFNNTPIGTGPFKFIKRVAGDHIEVAANDGYFGEGPYLKSFTFKYIPDLTVLYTQFEAGDIDVVGLSWISPDNYDEARHLRDRVVKIMPASLIECIALNTAKFPLSDPSVRQAVYLAMDKATIISQIYRGLPISTESYMPQQSYYYNKTLPPHEYSIEKAKALLDRAGWTVGSGGIREKDGVKLSFTNSTTAGNHLREELQEYLQQTLQQAGIEMKISNMPAAVLFGDFWMMSKFESVLHGQDYLTGSDPDTSDFFLSTNSAAKGGQGLNFWEYANPEVDKLLAEGNTIFVPEQRRPVYLKIQEIIRQDLPFLPIYQYVRIGGFKAGVEGVEGNVNNRIDTWNVNTWRWS